MFVKCVQCRREFQYGQDFNDHLFQHEKRCYHESDRNGRRRCIVECEICGFIDEREDDDFLLEDHMSHHEIIWHEAPKGLLWISELPYWWYPDF